MMKPYNSDSVIRLRLTSQFFQDAHLRLASEWHPDLPPASLVMASYAEALSDNALSVNEEEGRRIFGEIEKMLGGEDETIGDAVATCFLETLQSRASRGTPGVSRMFAWLGDKSLQYCREWDQFTGASTPGMP